MPWDSERYHHHHPTHRLILETAQEEPFRGALGGWTRASPVLPIDAYAELLYRHGGEDITVFEKVYPHLLENADALADWTSGTALVPYFERLEPELRERFMDRYHQRLRERFPDSPVFFGFRRTLLAATRGEKVKPVMTSRSPTGLEAIPNLNNRL